MTAFELFFIIIWLFTIGAFVFWVNCMYASMGKVIASSMKKFDKRIKALEDSKR